MFFLEFLLRGGLIGRDAEYSGSGLLDLLECVAEPARLQRSAGSIRLGKEKKDHVLAPVIFESYRFAFFIGKRELRGFIINFHGFLVFYYFNEFI